VRKLTTILALLVGLTLTLAPPSPAQGSILENTLTLGSAAALPDLWSGQEPVYSSSQTVAYETTSVAVALPETGVSAEGDAVALAAASATSGGVLSTTYYDIYYGQWESVAQGLSAYLDAAFTTARDVLGYDNSGYGKITITFYSDPSSSTSGYMYWGENGIYLNLLYGSSITDSYLQSYGSTVAHETAHVLFFHETNLDERYAYTTVGGSCTTWVTEALSYYVSDVVYPYGDQYSASTLGSLLYYYSWNGQWRSSWYASGRDYKYGTADSLDLVQLESIGQFLADYGGGWDAIHQTLDELASSGDFDTAFRLAYGLETGQFTTSSGAFVNTLYSQYIYYYLGHF